MRNVTDPTSPHRFVLESDHFGVALSAFCPYVYVRDARDQWVLALVGAGSDRGGGEFELRSPASPRLAYTNVREEGDGVVLEGQVGNVGVTTQLRPTKRGVHVWTALRTAEDLELDRLWSSFWFVPRGKPLSQYGRTAEVWAPRLRPGDDEIIAEPTFRSPVLTIEAGGLGVILLPDPSAARWGSPVPTALDLDFDDGRRDAPRLSYGLAATRERERGVFVSVPGHTVRVPSGATISYAYELQAFASAERGSTFRTAVRSLWRNLGRENGVRGTERTPWTKAVEPLIVGDTRPDGPVLFQPSANAMRTAYGLYVWGRRLGERRWSHQANRTRGLLLSAPLRSGCFPSGYDPARNEWFHASRKYPALRRTGTPAEYYSVSDMAWTAYWMLRWHRDLHPSPRLRERAIGVGEFLAASQLRSGVLPAFYRAEKLEPVEPLRESAETAAGVLLLAELARRAGRGTFLRAALRGARYLLDEVVPKRRYLDFQTFFASSPRRVDVTDRHTRVGPQGTLAMLWCAEGLRVLHDLTGEDAFFDAGLRSLDDLCAHQALWPDGSAGIGEFPAMNLDAGFEDDGQGLFAETLLRYYRETGHEEYFDRGLACIDASLRRRRIEALAGAAAVERLFGHLFVDAKRHLVRSIDGSIRPKLGADGGGLRVQLEDVLGRPHSVELVVEGMPAETDVRWKQEPVETSRTHKALRARLQLGAGEAGELLIEPREAEALSAG